MNILDSPVSIFANYNTPSNPQTVTIRQFLTSTKYREAVERIRLIEVKAERDKLKATLPAITPSGIFSYRAADALVKHSGLICLDIDYKGNEAVGNFFELKDQLVKIPNVAFCIKSVSGKGYAVGIPIAYPERHGQHFDALKRIFWKFGLVIDKACRDVTRLRGYSYDVDAHMNDNAKVFALYDEPKPKQRKNYTLHPNTPYTGCNNPLQACIRIIRNSVDGQRHYDLLKAAKLAGGYIAGGLLDESIAEAELETANKEASAGNTNERNAGRYNPLKTIRDGIAYGKSAPIREPQNSRYKPEPLIYTPLSLGLMQATTPPLTEQDLIKLWGK